LALQRDASILQPLSSLCVAGVVAVPGPVHPPLPLQMALYLTFPVAMFWISNQAEWFEDHVIQRKVGIRRMFTGSFQGLGEGMGHQSAGDYCLPPKSQPYPGYGALGTPGS
jgi:hypothetical protein